MAQISCPNCDTVHELDDALLSAKPRRMRCASCREIFTTAGQGANQSPPAILPRAEPEDMFTPSSAEEADAGEQAASLDAVLGKPSDGQIDFDSIDIAHEPDSSAPPPPDPFDAIILPEPAPVVEERDPAERAAEAAALRREKAQQEQSEYIPSPSSGLKKPSAAVVLMAAGLWTLVTIGVFRNEIARVVPETIPLFATVGLDVNRTALDILDVRSAVALEEGQETLEISGKIANHSKIAQQVPVLRLAVRNPAGLEVYVWSTPAEKSELSAGETIEFRRKLASPPSDAQTVMVRFVAKDDIVSSIR